METSIDPTSVSIVNGVPLDSVWKMRAMQYDVDTPCLFTAFNSTRTPVFLSQRYALRLHVVQHSVTNFDVGVALVTTVPQRWQYQSLSPMSLSFSLVPLLRWYAPSSISNYCNKVRKLLNGDVVGVAIDPNETNPFRVLDKAMNNPNTPEAIKTEDLDRNHHGQLLAGVNFFLKPKLRKQFEF